MQLRPIAMAALALSAIGSAHAVDLTAAGYTQSFDSMGTTGTTPPTGWRLLQGESGTSNTTWSTAITANGASASVASMVATSGALTATSAPTATNNNGYNAALSAGNTADRVLATSPTQVSGAALELSLTNQSGASFDQLTLSYDTVRFTAASTANELPGYQLFYSLNDSSWTNVTALNPTLATVPNTVGVTSVSNALVNLGAAVAPGQTIELRWVDDNAVQTSPDQIIGLNNVSVAPVVSAVPEPANWALMLAGASMLGGAVLRRRR